jgi:hypothetical protein
VFLHFIIKIKKLERNSKMLLLVFDYEKANAFLETFWFMLTVFTTAAEVAGTVVFGIFVNQVLRIHALGVVAEMRSIVFVSFDAEQLEEGLCNSGRALLVDDAIVFEEPRKVENDTAIVVVVDAKVRSLAAFCRFPTSSVNIDRSIVRELFLELLGKFLLLFGSEAFKGLEWLQIDDLSSCCFAHFVKKSYFYDRFFFFKE